MPGYFFKVGYGFSADRLHYQYIYIAAPRNTDDSAIAFFHYLLQDLQIPDPYTDVEVLSRVSEEEFFNIARYVEIHGGFFQV